MKGSLLKLETAKSTLIIPTRDAVIKLLYIAGYIAQIIAGYLLFGTKGALLVVALIVFNFRGKL